MKHCRTEECWRMVLTCSNESLFSLIIQLYYISINSTVQFHAVLLLRWVACKEFKLWAGQWSLLEYRPSEFRCFRSAFPPKTKPKTKTQHHFLPKTKVTETIKNEHFRHRKRKRNSVGLVPYYHLQTLSVSVFYCSCVSACLFCMCCSLSFYGPRCLK